MISIDEEKRFEELCQKLEAGVSLRSIFHQPKPIMSNTLFYRLIKENAHLKERYARAKEVYADHIFDEILSISDHSEQDHTPFTGGNVIQRDRLRVDARKWILSKLAPKKYGDKLDIEHSGIPEAPKVLSVTIVKPDQDDE